MKLDSLSSKLSRYIQLHRSTIVAIAIISAVGLLSVSWFRGDFSIAGGDMLFPPDRQQIFIRGFYAWDGQSLGGANPRILAGFIPYNVFLFLSEMVGLSLISAEKLWFYLMFTSAGLSMYYLTAAVIREKHRHVAGVTSALFFMLNPYVAIIMVPTLWIHVIFLPLILGMYIRGLNERRGLKYILLMCVVWVLTCTSGYVDPKLAILDWAPLFLYFFFHIVVNRSRKEIIKSLRFTIVLFTLWTALNAYWIIPVAFSLKETIASPLEVYSTIGTTRLESYTLNSAPLSEALRLLGFWGLHSGYKGFPYFYWAPVYDTYIFIAIGFLIPLVAFSSLLHKPRNKHVLFFSIVAVAGLFLINGAYSPFSWINIYLVTHIPFAIDVVSNPYMTGGMYLVLGYAFLFGYAISLLYDRLSKVKLSFLNHSPQILRCILVGFIVFLIIGVYAFPLWTGEVIYPGNEILASNRFNIPSYYYDASSWLGAQHEEFNIFPLPYSLVGYAAYTWEPEGFNGPDPTELILNRPVVSSTSGGGVGMYVASYLVNNSTDDLAKILALMNVKYVLFHRDANWEFLEGHGWYISTSSKSFESILKSQTGLHLEASFGELDFYRNDYWKPMHIYATTNSILIDGGLSQMIKVVERNDFTPIESVLLLSDQLGAQQISALPVNTILIQNQNLSSTLNAAAIALNTKRIVYAIDFPPSIITQYYSGWKSVISTNGQGDSDILIFSSPSECPYINAFPQNFTNWNAYNSTLIYITTSSSPLTINSITADGTQVNATAWWQTDTSWRTGWPITIPSNQRAIIQVNQQTNNITLQTDSDTITLPVTDGRTNPSPTKAPSETSTTVFTPKAGNYLLAINVATGYGYGNFLTKIDDQTTSINTNSQEQGPVFTYKYIGPTNLTAGYHTISPSGENTSILVSDGLANPINWVSTFTNQNYVARYYPDWKAVVRTDGTEQWDAISFPTLNQCPYIFPLDFTSWNSYNSTLVYTATDDNPLRIDEILTDGNVTSDITGVWWQTDWVGMSTKPVTYPIIIPPNQKAIIQINHKADTVALKTNPPKIGNMLLYTLKSGENFADVNNLLSANQTDSPSITYEEINPTKYAVHVNASNPFYLIFSETYDNNWIASIDGQPVPNEYHFTANGFANGWYINKTGTFTITLEFWPQNLFYAGSAISIITLILCTVYVSKDRIKTIYKKCIKKNKLPIT
jgi:hypothetical protein